MPLSGPSHLAPELRPPQEMIDRWVRGAMLQRANYILGSDSSTVAAELKAYGVSKFVDEFIEYAKSSGWAIEAADVPYLQHMAGRLPK